MADGDGVGVLEAQRREPPHAVTIGAFASHGGKHRARIVSRRVAEDDDEACAGILGVHIDGTAPECGVGDVGPAESEAPLHASPSSFEELGEHLGEDVGLGERLRRDHDWPGRRLGRLGRLERLGRRLGRLGRLGPLGGYRVVRLLFGAWGFGCEGLGRGTPRRRAARQVAMWARSCRDR